MHPSNRRVLNIFKMKIQLILTLIITTILSCSNNIQSNLDQNIDKSFYQFVAEQNAILDDLLPQRPAERGDYTNVESLHLWNNLSDAQWEKMEVYYLDRLHTMTKFDTSLLSKEALIQYHILKYESELEINRAKFKEFENAFSVNYFYSVPSSLEDWLHTNHRVSNEIEAIAYIGRLKNIPKLFIQIQDNLLVAKENGIISAKIEIAKSIARYKEMANSMRKGDSTIDRDIVDKFTLLKIKNVKSLSDEAHHIIKNQVALAYESLANFLETEIYPFGEEHIGLWQYGNEGLAYYQFLIKEQTSLDISPEEIIELGNQLVAKIKAELISLKNKMVDDSTSLSEFLNTYRQKGGLSSTDVKKLMEAKAKAMSPKWKTLFDIPIPEVKIKFDPFESRAREELDYTTSPPTPIFYLNPNVTSNNYTYTKWDLLELLAHEAIPGHGLEQYNTAMLELPTFRKHFSVPAFAEGWALYAEYLPKEIGFYDKNEEELGRLASSMFRACRLIVDASIHTGKMSQEEATSFFLDRSPYPKGMIEGQVLRYIAFPAQATCYYLGANTIWNLRHEAEEKLGDSFDIRRFHSAILSHGNVPLQLLEKLVQKWIMREHTKLTDASFSTIKINFCNIITSRKVLGTKDDFITALTPFDLAARMKSTEPVSEKMYLEFIKDQVLSFTIEEEVRIQRLMKEVRPRLDALNLAIPSGEILFIKTTGNEEGRAAYTRNNAIILPVNKLEVSDEKLQATLIHEIWHILSRYNQEQKLAMYKIIGFTPCEVKYPDSLQKLRVTNPDAIECTYCYTGIVSGNKVLVAPFLFASDLYDDKEGKKEFFQYIVSVQRTRKRHPSLYNLADGLILNTSDLENYNDDVFQTGNDYLFHPEEICAEHFVQIILNPSNSSKYSEGFKKILFNK